MHFDHAGIATDDAAGLAETYCELFRTRVAHEEQFGDLHVLFLEFGDSYFELLEPTGEGTIARYLDRNGPGIHHLALTTSDIEAALARAKTMDVECIDEEPRPGAWGHDVAFLHPKSTGGILVEFVQH
ncbi:methylmalonyl-CoA epimerase [Halomarina ordinaria]|uniref:Methylmalonyl-CoA epimerase n=1 Tax=Halomarina ordinaria TaxID=3033939 RepID=A0ABD5U7B0_9EURY|nr:methylmalonyl-CoA epimerase [Halomarina sp. PSRA2]